MFDAQVSKRLRLGVGLLALLIPGMGAFAAEVPPGFENTTFINGNQFPGAAAIEFDPDDDLWVARRRGDIYIFRDEMQIQVADIYGPDYVNVGERGLHSFVLDPDYATNGHVWIYYTYTPESGPVVNRLSRFTNVGDNLQSEAVMLEGPPLDNTIHNGGCLGFASDKTLFLGMGDDGRSNTTAQNSFDLRGSIIHLNRDGSGAADNPFLDGVEGDPRIWAQGVRNPYRCAMQPHTDNLFFTDVGGATWEEVNIGIAAGNFGWQFVEGPDPPGVPGMTYPLYSYNHNGGTAAVVSGAHVNHGEFHPDYEGDFFFADWWREEIYRMVLTDSSTLDYVETWATDMGKLLDFEIGPDGALWYITQQIPETSVGRIEFIGGDNQQPNAVGVPIPDSGLAPLMVVLDGSGSSDPDDDPLTYDWDFGDGGSSTDAAPSHSYAAGVWEAELSVDDGQGLSSSTAPLRIVSGNERPVANVATPTDGTRYNAGQQFSYSGTGSDPQEGSIPCSQFTWWVIFHHDVHTHPFVGPLQGDCSGSFTIPTSGETSTNTWYEIRLQVQDTGQPIGSEAVLVGEHSVEILPNTSVMTLESAPVPDLTLSFDTVPFTAPMSVGSVVGFVRTIGAPESQLHADGHTYRWLSWSDSGSMEHTVPAPPSDTTYTASFVCDVIAEAEQLVLSKQAGGDLQLSWSPVVDDCLASGPERYRIYTASTPRPSSPPGSFPTDPQWTLAGDSDDQSFSYTPPSGDDTYFLIVPVGTDGLDGAVGHYGQ